MECLICLTENLNQHSSHYELCTSFCELFSIEKDFLNDLCKSNFCEYCTEKLEIIWMTLLELKRMKEELKGSLEESEKMRLKCQNASNISLRLKIFKELNLSSKCPQVVIELEKENFNPIIVNTDEMIKLEKNIDPSSPSMFDNSEIFVEFPDENEKKLDPLYIEALTNQVVIPLKRIEQMSQKELGISISFEPLFNPPSSSKVISPQKKEIDLENSIFSSDDDFFPVPSSQPNHLNCSPNEELLKKKQIEGNKSLEEKQNPLRRIPRKRHSMRKIRKSVKEGTYVFEGFTTIESESEAEGQKSSIKKSHKKQFSQLSSNVISPCKKEIAISSNDKDFSNSSQINLNPRSNASPNKEKFNKVELESNELQQEGEILSKRITRKRTNEREIESSSVFDGFTMCKSKSEKEIPKPANQKSDKVEFPCPYANDDCPVICATQRALNLHVKNAHEGDSSFTEFSSTDEETRKRRHREDVRRRPQLRTKRKYKRKRNYFQCTYTEECEFKTAVEYIYDAHVKQVHEGIERPHHCKICKKDYKNLNGFHTHMRKHKNGPKDFFCDQCGKSFTRLFSLNNHVARFHNPQREEDLKNCSVCDKRVYKGDLWSHMVYKHGDKEKFKCKVCNKGFPTNYLLQNHELRHNVREDGKKAYLCDQCDKSYDTSVSLKIHIAEMHSGPAPHSCDLCDYKTYTLPRLRDHKTRFHMNPQDFSFVCNWDGCEKKFGTKQRLKRHLLIHKGEKPFLCDVCSKAFGRKTQLQQHMAIHSTEFPFTCELCEKKFQSKNFLILHVRWHKIKEEKRLLKLNK